MSSFLVDCIPELPEIGFAVAAMFGIEILPSKYLAKNRTNAHAERESIEDGEFLSLWVVWLITGSRCIATIFAEAAGDRADGVTLTFLGIVVCIIVIVSMLALSKFGDALFNRQPTVVRLVLRSVPLVFVLASLSLHVV
ncbi:MAG: hypothetical protein MPJ50_15430 [Pirellulales bacterium]|nr:hypothetical protein [Pirellulales bacterium]